jgi:hypothetical protein
MFVKSHFTATSFVGGQIQFGKHYFLFYATDVVPMEKA